MIMCGSRNERGVITNKHLAQHLRNAKKPQRHRSKIILLAVALVTVIVLLITATLHFFSEPYVIVVFPGQTQRMAITLPHPHI